MYHFANKNVTFICSLNILTGNIYKLLHVTCACLIFWYNCFSLLSVSVISSLLYNYLFLDFCNVHFSFMFRQLHSLQYWTIRDADQNVFRVFGLWTLSFLICVIKHFLLCLCICYSFVWYNWVTLIVLIFILLILSLAILSTCIHLNKVKSY